MQNIQGKLYNAKQIQTIHGSLSYLSKTIIKEPYQCLTAISNIHTTL